MKPIWSLLFLLWSVSTQAQQTTILTQQEPNVPSILPAEAATFFRTFEDAVKYLASKGKPRDQRRAFAERFAIQFAEGAVIQVMNGKKKLNLKPLEYFYRLVDLNYDSIDISFKIESEQAWQQKSEWWAKQYGFKQKTTCKKNGKVVLMDYTLKTMDLFFLYSASNQTWTKKYGHVLAHSTKTLN